MAVLIDPDNLARTSIGVSSVDTQGKSASNTYNDILPVSDISLGISAPAGATNPVTVNTYAKLLDAAARALISNSKNSYNYVTFTISQRIIT